MGDIATSTSVFKLRVVSAADPRTAGVERAVEGQIVVGRDASCDFVIPDDTVSRRHARIEPAPDGLKVTDTGSANGTWFKSRRVTELVARPGDRFALGAAVLECIEERNAVLQPMRPAPDLGTVYLPAPKRAPGPPRQPAAPRVPADLPPITAESRLEDLGDPIEANAHRPFLIDDPGRFYFVVKGGVMLFTVAVSQGVPIGPRTHFMGIEAGLGIFGFGTGEGSFGSGFLAVPKPGTRLRSMPRASVEQLTAAGNAGAAAVVEAWTGALIRTMAVRPKGEEPPGTNLMVGSEAALPRGQRATSARGVVWVEIPSGGTIVNGTTVPEFGGESRLFPIGPQSWIESVVPGDVPLTLRPMETLAVLARPDFWLGFDAFQAIVCEEELVNKKLAAVDEFVRLEEKAHRSDAAEIAGYDAIESVLRRDRSRAPEAMESAAAEPVLAACRLVGHALGLRVKPHPAATDKLGYEETVNAIAGASGFRTRVVALRGEWWGADQGPMLCQRAETREPVPVLPNGPRAYVIVDPATGGRQRVDGEVAATLSGFGYSFYRPFPDEPLTIRGLVAFGTRGLALDYRTLVGMAAVIGLFGTVTPYLTGQLFAVAIPQADRAMLVGFALALLMAAAAGSVFKFVQGVATIRIQARMGASIQAAVWDRLMNLPATFFRSFESGDLADRAGAVDQIQELISGAGVSAILGSLSGLFFVVQMFSYNLRLAFAAVLLTVAYVGVTMLANYRQLRHQRVEATLRGRISGLVLNLISGVSKLRITGAEQHAFRIWAQQFAEQRRITFRVGTIQNVASTFTTVFPVFSSIVLFMVMLYDQGEAAKTHLPGLTTGDFIAFVTAYGMFLGAMQALGDASLNLLRIVPLYERLRPVLEARPEADSTKAFPGRLKGEIELSHLHFRYDSESPYVVNDLSLKLSPGEFVAFVGASGCGKSTLMRLMLGFEQPASGTIYYDGQDLSALDLRMVRQQIGVVLQVSRVMPTEIYRNIIGATSHTIDDAWDAAEKAGLADDIRNMPMGMHTYVSEGGGTLSGGQRQRLMIARAIVNKPKILFLDEATSALDNRAQAVVTESLDRMDATRIVIAHRLSTVINAHRICFLEGGRVVEMGSHQELMALNGKFAELARRQMA